MISEARRRGCSTRKTREKRISLDVLYWLRGRLHDQPGTRQVQAQATRSILVRFISASCALRLPPRLAPPPYRLKEHGLHCITTHAHTVSKPLSAFALPRSSACAGRSLHSAHQIFHDLCRRVSLIDFCLRWGLPRCTRVLGLP